MEVKFPGYLISHQKQCFCDIQAPPTTQQNSGGCDQILVLEIKNTAIFLMEQVEFQSAVN